MAVNAANPNNVMVGEAAVYVATWGLTTPLQPEPVPSDYLPYGFNWGGNWAQVGATDDGMTVSYDPKPNPIYIEEQPNPVAVPIDTADVTVNFTIAEDVLSNLLIAYGVGTLATVAASASSIGKSTYTFGTVLTPFTVGFESINPNGSSASSAGRTTTTGATTSSSANFTDTAGAFTVQDVGRVITATGVPVGTYIISITSGTVVVMSAPATATGSTLATTYGALAATPYFRRAYFPKVVSGQAKIDTSYRRAKDKRMYAVSMQTICALNTVLVWDQSAVAT
jgi:hypothetical protein